MYDYKENIESNIRILLNDEVGQFYNLNHYDGDADALAEDLYTYCWNNDFVTGNGSDGCYFTLTSESERAVKDNMNILQDVANDWGEEDKIQQALEEENWDWLDVTIRCYLLYSCVREIVDGMVEDYEIPTESPEITSEEEDYDEGFNDLEESAIKHKKRLRF